MANCISLVRMWMNRVTGSEGMISSTVKQEMETISRGDAISDLEFLCAFQAYLIYLITAYFFPIGDTSLVDDSSLITMHDLAFRTAKAGFTCKAELSHVAPTWESWIIASSKRRSLLTMYLFTNVYNFGKGIPNFLSKESTAWNDDGILDLVFIETSNTGTGDVEVHMASGVSQTNIHRRQYNTEKDSFVVGQIADIL
ncbi:hypothetical protein AbraIFM66950_005333 [Aspergillus brasiliensis]|nr:hypothetical protein AbraIFM66950_005333 [Aspergillus brasiliensis]